MVRDIHRKKAEAMRGIRIISYEMVKLFATAPTINGRLPVFDLLKTITMWLVIWCHCIAVLGHASWDNEAYRFIYTFHMPLFIFISGFFSFSSLHLSWKSLLRKKTVQLIIPGLVWGTIIVAMLSLLNSIDKLGEAPVPFYKYSWFLKTLFICYVIAWIFKANNTTNGVISFITLGLLLSHISMTIQIPLMYACFICGLFFRIYFAVWLHRIKIISIICTIIWISIYFAIPDYYDYLPVTLIGWADINLHNIVYEIFRTIMGVAAALSILGITYYVTQNKWFSNATKLLTNWGNHTLGVYLIQELVVVHVMSRYIDWSHTNPMVMTFIYTPISAIVVMSFLVFIVHLIIQAKYSRLLLLGIK